MNNKNYMKFIPLICSLFLLTFPQKAAVHAQITLDGTLGQSGPIAGCANDGITEYRIPAGVGRMEGNNLFHSFGMFSINTNESVIFNGPDTVENIIGRVTGGNPSWIDGLLCSEIPGADLFLINPWGVVFGPNACIDVQGSFHVSTADYIRLGEAGFFNALHPDEDILSVAPPGAFGFLDDLNSGITLEGSFLEVSKGNTISIAGGDIDMRDSVIYSEGGGIFMTSVSSAGEVSLAESGLGVESFRRYGDIGLSADSWIAVIGEEPGSIVIRGGQFIAEHSSVFTISEGGKGAGCIDLRLSGGLSLSGHGDITSYATVDGQGGDVMIEAEGIRISDGGRINSACSGSAKGGNINIEVTGSLDIEGGGACPGSISLWSEGAGESGDLTLAASQLNIADDGLIAGAAYASGRGPDILIDVDNLTLTEGGNIDNSSYMAGQGGDLRIHASFYMGISGCGEYKSGIYALAHGQGDAGKVSISAESVKISNEGVITGETYPGSQGSGADVVIDAGTLCLTTGGEIVLNANGEGEGGSLEAIARESVLISGWGEYSASGIGAEVNSSGDAGSIFLQAPFLTIDDGGRISGTIKGEGRGADIAINGGAVDMIDGYISVSSLNGAAGESGTITISAKDAVTISSLAGGLDSLSGLFSLTAGTGPAGDIYLNAPFLNIENGGQITTSTMSEKGAGGAINLAIGTLDLTQGGRIDSSANQGYGDGGTIEIEAEDAISISGKGEIVSLSNSQGDAGYVRICSPSLIVRDEGSIQTLSGASSTGNAGAIIIETAWMEIRDGGWLNSSTLGTGHGGKIEVDAEESLLIMNKSGEGIPTGLFSMTASTGDAGSIFASTHFISIGGDDSIIMASSIGGGKGGDIDIEADLLSLSDNACIGADSEGMGDAGDISIEAHDAVYCDKGLITTEALCADGGNIRIATDYMLQLEGSAVTATVKGGKGDGGNISIDPVFVIVNNSSIIANAEGGDGGNIRIVSDCFLSSPGSRISASSTLGIDGRVEIVSPYREVSNTLALLPGVFLDVESLLPRSCLGGDGEDMSSLLLIGRKAPPGPEGLLPGLFISWF